MCLFDKLKQLQEDNVILTKENKNLKDEYKKLKEKYDRLYKILYMLDDEEIKIGNINLGDFILKKL